MALGFKNFTKYAHVNVFKKTNHVAINKISYNKHTSGISINLSH